MSENTLAYGHLVNSITQDGKLRTIFNEYDAELRENERLKIAREQILTQMNTMALDHMLVCEAFAGMNAQREEQNRVNGIMELCYSQVLKMEHLLENKKFKNICKYTMLLKQNEAQTVHKSLESAHSSELENLAILECRHFVKELRNCLCVLDRSQQELDIVQRSFKDSQIQKKMNLQRANGQLNLKILHLLLQRKDLIQLKKTLANCAANNLQQQHQQQQPVAQGLHVSIPSLQKHGDKFIIQSALDFLKSFPTGDISNNQIQSNSAHEPNTLHSILMVDGNRNTSSPTKQVRFAPSPLYENEDDVMASTDNWEELVGRMDINLDNVEQLPATMDSAVSTSFADPSSTGFVITSESIPTPRNNFGNICPQPLTAIVTTSGSDPTTSRDSLAPKAKFVKSLTAITFAQPPTVAHSARVVQASTAFATPSELITTTSGNNFERIFAQSLTETKTKSKSITATPHKEFMFSSPESSSTAMSEEPLLFAAQNDDFFLNFTYDTNGQKNKADYEL
ncbi:uncharacterized protein LOC111519281 [Drosophila willistoni]|uniref:uncharacterized protein LOC111519281 n=1 Tax=Drosophila willistoni TaxID=7260 RepID=UPI00017D8D5A|nr:uncharacterized protein LOC111519281 [Drosophila willistoni]